MANQSTTESNPHTQSERQALQHIDTATADALQQAFQEINALQPLLRLLFTQMRTLCQTSGLHFRQTASNIDLLFGQECAHHASYKLQFRGEYLGELTRYYKQPQRELDIETGEDLISLALLSLRNCVLMYEEDSQADLVTTAGLSHAEQIALSEQLSPRSPAERGTHPHDVLMLIGLDNLEAITAAGGTIWRDSIVRATFEQVSEGLRSADSVYLIGDDLIAVLLQNSSLAQARQVTRKVRTLISSLHLQDNHVEEQLTAGIGICSAKDAVSADDVLFNARTALAHARAAGRNQDRIYTPESVSYLN